jgi:hypothetical protein
MHEWALLALGHHGCSRSSLAAAACPRADTSLAPFLFIIGCVLHLYVSGPISHLQYAKPARGTCALLQLFPDRGQSTEFCKRPGGFFRGCRHSLDTRRSLPLHSLSKALVHCVLCCLQMAGVINVEVLMSRGGASEQRMFRPKEHTPVEQVVQLLRDEYGPGSLESAGVALLSGPGYGLEAGNYVYRVFAAPGGIGSCLLQHSEVLVP